MSIRDYPDAFWIGHPGALLPLPGAKGGLSSTSERAATFGTSAAGYKRVYMAARRPTYREWQVSMPLVRPDQIAVLDHLIMATDPPYVWVDAWARVTNVLTPAASILVGVIPALSPLGRQPLDGGGWAADAAANPGSGLVRIAPAPVIGDMPVTCSAWLASPVGGTVSAQWLDSAGANLGAPVTGVAVAGTEVLRRASVTATPPVGAAAVTVLCDGVSVIAQPAVTWTDALTEYGSGGGATSVIVTKINRDIIRADSAMRAQSVSFTVTEVG